MKIREGAIAARRWFLILVLPAVLLLAACGETAEATWQEQYDLGVKYLSEGNYEEAIIAFTAAIDIDAKRPEAFIGRGDAYALSGDTEDNLSAAQSDYEAAIALDETLPGGWLGLADVYIRRGDYDKALEILREALEKTGNDQSIADKLAEMESGSFADSAGNVRRMDSYDGAGNLVFYHTYTYNEGGRRSSVTSFDAAGNQTGTVDITYTEDGEPLSGYHYTDTGEVAKIEYGYDDRGNVVEQIFYSREGEVDTRYSIEYDSAGNKARQEQWGPDDILWGFSTFTYDSSGQLTREDRYDKNGASEGYFLYEYNSEGQRTSYSSYMAEGDLFFVWVSRYDDQGNYLGEDHYDGEGNLTQSTVRS